MFYQLTSRNIRVSDKLLDNAVVILLDGIFALIDSRETIMIDDVR